MATVLGATIVTRWFKTNRGLMMGIMSASSATGLLIFLPLLAKLAQSGGWQPVVVTVSVAIACMLPLVYFLIPERPASIGLSRFGAEGEEAQVAPPAIGNFLTATLSTLRRAAGTRVFWYLFATFFVCGFTTNGLVGTHLIAFCGDMGIQEVQAAGLLALMGVFDLIGTTLSGWLTDRYDPRKLLGIYYGIRGLALIYLPFFRLLGHQPRHLRHLLRPRLDRNRAADAQACQRILRRQERAARFRLDCRRPPASAPRLQPSSAASLRELQGDYTTAFMIAGMTAIAAGALSLLINPTDAEARFPRTQPA